jgi:hypothetical protein
VKIKSKVKSGNGWGRKIKSGIKAGGGNGGW